MCETKVTKNSAASLRGGGSAALGVSTVAEVYPLISVSALGEAIPAALRPEHMHKTGTIASIIWSVSLSVDTQGRVAYVFPARGDALACHISTQTRSAVLEMYTIVAMSALFPHQLDEFEAEQHGAGLSCEVLTKPNSSYLTDGRSKCQRDTFKLSRSGAICQSQ